MFSDPLATQIQTELSSAPALYKMFNLKYSNFISSKVLTYIKCENFTQGPASFNLQNTSRLTPVNLAYASYESTDINVESWPLLVMHGLLGSKGNWKSLCKVFHQKTVPQRKVVAMDARNHGDSPHSAQHTYHHLAEDIKLLMEKLKIDKTVLLGHSMGGRAVMLFALKYVSDGFIIFVFRNFLWSGLQVV